MKIAVFPVTNRVHWARMEPLILGLSKHDIDIRICLAHAGLLSKYGELEDQITRAGFKIDRRIDCLLESKSNAAMAKTTGLAMFEFAGYLDERKPDWVIIRGDRYEMLAPAFAAACQNIPVVHIEGGDVSGNIDDKVRHCLTKLSSLHFVTNEQSRRRVIQLGESPDFVFDTGSLEIDACKAAPMEFPGHLFTTYTGVGQTWNLSDGYLLLMLHPVTTEADQAFSHMMACLQASLSFGLGVICLWPNVDAGSEGTSKAIRAFRENNPHAKLHVFKGFSPHDFLCVLRHAKCLIGNSSAGIKEASFLGTPVVNVGSRQALRLRGPNVIDSPPELESLTLNIGKQLKASRYPVSNLYGNGTAAQTMVKILNEIEIPKIKSFHDITIISDMELRS